MRAVLFCWARLVSHTFTIADLERSNKMSKTIASSGPMDFSNLVAMHVNRQSLEMARADELLKDAVRGMGIHPGAGETAAPKALASKQKRKLSAEKECGKSAYDLFNKEQIELEQKKGCRKSQKGWPHFRLRPTA